MAAVHVNSPIVGRSSSHPANHPTNLTAIKAYQFCDSGFPNLFCSLTSTQIFIVIHHYSWQSKFHNNWAGWEKKNYATMTFNIWNGEGGGLVGLELLCHKQYLTNIIKLNIWYFFDGISSPTKALVPLGIWNWIFGFGKGYLRFLIIHHNSNFMTVCVLWPSHVP